MNKTGKEIRTPDQRLRVFVSSTLKELSQERQAAQLAISNLRLIPVMFELGARPHPSDELYRAYLEQSQVFIGIYWQQYGWIGPGKELSGIEDEYLLAADLPKLIYLKSPAPDLEPRLKEMIKKIQQDNSVSYKRFSTAIELQELVENDLAVLLTEKFYAQERYDQRSGELEETPRFESQHLKIDSSLPVQPTQFIGREREIKEVCNLIGRDEVRLVTLIGPGGTGKTRLSLKVGEECLQQTDSGVVFIPLAEVRDGDLLVSKLAQQLGLREGGSQPLLESLKKYLQEQQILLILDNFEQILDGAEVIADLMLSAAGFKVLVTSRTLLNLRGEYEYQVPPLTVPDRNQIIDAELVRQSEAVQLFAARASAASPRFELNSDTLPLVAEICYQLDGLPLAIELAAARIKLLTPEMILERLAGRLDLLTGGARDLPERQRTLRNTLDWSYSLLDQESQALFSILSVFAGGFSLEAAEAVCKFRTGKCELDVLDGLEGLLDNSLLRSEITLQGETRFRMLEMIREYAQEKLADSGDLNAVRDRHAQYFINKMTEINLVIQTSESQTSLDWIEGEHDNLRATLAWILERPAFLEVGPVLLASMDWFWFRRGYLSEGREWSRKMLVQLGSEGRTPERVFTLFSMGALAMWQGDLREAIGSIDEALEVARWLEYPYHLAVVLLFKGTILVNMGRDQDALPILEEAQSLFEGLGMQWYVATTQVHIANAALGEGHTEKALENLAQAVAINDEIQEKWLQSFILNNFGEVSRVRGEYDLAQSYYLQSEALFREMGDTGELARLVHNLGYINLHLGKLDEAEEQFQESLSMFLKLNNQRGIAESIAAIAGLLISRRKYQSAAQLFGAAAYLLEQTGGSWWPADRVEIGKISGTLNDELDEKAFETLMVAGRMMGIEAAISMAQSGR
jgi:predicted ATPase/Tfp pilus assembly protein PilF